MVTRRRVLAAGALAALAGCSGGGATPATPGGLTVTSTAFESGAPISSAYTADGADVSPPLSIAGTAAAAESLALVLEDPDAPGGAFVHWLVWNLPAETAAIPEGVPRGETVGSLGGARQGTNGFGVVGYRGPKPPTEDGPHTYRFTVYALETGLDLAAGAKRAALYDAMAGRVVASGRLTGTYDR